MADANALILELRQKTGAGFMDCKKALTESNGKVEDALTILRKKGLADAAKRAARTMKEGKVGCLVGAGGGAIVEVSCETDFVARTPDFEALVAKLAEKTASGTLSSPEGAKDDIAPLAAKLGENITLRRLERFAAQKDRFTGAYVHHGGKIGALIEMSAPGYAAKSDVIAALSKEILLQIVGFSPRYLRREEVPAEIIAKEKEIHAEVLRKEGKPEAAVAKIVEGKINKLFYQAFCLLDQMSVRDNKTPVSKLIEDAGKQLGQSVTVTRFARYQVGE
ncbi:MAG TPA: translation elongation factor Ts [Elusimicrobiota bacterium]|nr:translation elongation factor Ts [Elusimicrobiota bacterium]